MSQSKYDDSDISENIKKILYDVNDILRQCNRNTDTLSIMAITKTVPAYKVNIAFENGINLFGENKVQEYLQKNSDYHFNKDSIHFVGHLQSNKIKYIINNVSMIESVDSFELAKKISNIANEKMDILLQVNIGKEETKFGVFPENVIEVCKLVSELKNIKLKGLMTIPPKENSDYYFGKMQWIFNEINYKKILDYDLSVLSMGMSDDYRQAIENGSTQIRLGKAIFGKRN